MVRDSDVEGRIEEQLVAKCEQDLARLERKHRADRFEERRLDEHLAELERRHRANKLAESEGSLTR